MSEAMKDATKRASKYYDDAIAQLQRAYDGLKNNSRAFVRVNYKTGQHILEKAETEWYHSTQTKTLTVKRKRAKSLERKVHDAIYKRWL